MNELSEKEKITREQMNELLEKEKITQEKIKEMSLKMHKLEQTLQTNIPNNIKNTEKLRGIIYLIQPPDFVGTDIYKIGYSSKPDLSRCKDYGKGVRYICICECENPQELEKKLIIKFNEIFILHKGKEYFRGDKSKMRKELNKLFDEHENLQIPIQDEKCKEINEFKNDGNDTN